MKKSYSGKVVANLVFLLALVSVLFVASFVFNFMGGFELKPAQGFYRILGEDLNIQMINYGSESGVITISGRSLPGEQIKQNIQVKMPNTDLENFTLRVRGYIEQGSMASGVKFGGFDFWEYNSDGYYYYTGEPAKLQEIGICTDIVLPENISLKSNIYYSLIISVELFVL